MIPPITLLRICQILSFSQVFLFDGVHSQTSMNLKTTRISKIQYLEEEEEDHGIQDVWIRRQFDIARFI